MGAATILLGVLGRPHGVRGWMHVRSFTASAEDLTRYGVLTDETGERWTLAWCAPGVAALTRADGTKVADREQAARLTNRRLYVPRSQLPAPRADEYYLSDLIGARAVSPAGEPVGRVEAVHDYGAGASLELLQPDGSALLVPFTRASVPSVHLGEGVLVVAVPTEVAGEQPCGAPA